ncbi:hypothetical protein J6590_030161 [Homalodisca vitripennis]|nr:hypothetical protein J6590_030161 [Homalodisca vitripennis]
MGAVGGDGDNEDDKEKEEEAERERQEAIREAEERRKEKHRKMEEEREKMRQEIRDKGVESGLPNGVRLISYGLIVGHPELFTIYWWDQLTADSSRPAQIVK